MRPNPRNVLGRYDCAVIGTPGWGLHAGCAWTVGSYPSSELVSLPKSWITTPAISSQTIFPTMYDDEQSNAFVDLPYSTKYYVTQRTTSTATQYTTSTVLPTSTDSNGGDTYSSGDSGGGLLWLWLLLPASIIAFVVGVWWDCITTRLTFGSG